MPEAVYGLPKPAPATCRYIQSTVNSGGSGSLTTTLPALPRPGNRLIAVTGRQSGTSSETLSGGGATWRRIRSAVANGCTVEVWLGVVGDTPVAACTMSGGIGNWPNLALFEVTAGRMAGVMAAGSSDASGGVPFTTTEVVSPVTTRLAVFAYKSSSGGGANSQGQSGWRYPVGATDFLGAIFINPPGSLVTGATAGTNDVGVWQLLTLT